MLAALPLANDLFVSSTSTPICLRGLEALPSVRLRPAAILRLQDWVGEPFRRFVQGCRCPVYGLIRREDSTGGLEKLDLALQPSVMVREIRYLMCLKHVDLMPRARQDLIF
jgi:hypothetical protein